MKALYALAASLALSAQPDPDIDMLGGENYKEREVAMQNLKKRLEEDREGTTQKLLRVLKSPKLEAFRRAEILLKDYLEQQRELMAQETVRKMKEICDGKLPWKTDDVPPSFYKEAKGTNISPDWWKCRNATEAYLLNLVRSGIPIEPVVEKMKIEELHWIEASGKYQTPPLQPTWQKK